MFRTNRSPRIFIGSNLSLVFSQVLDRNKGLTKGRGRGIEQRQQGRRGGERGRSGERKPTNSKSQWARLADSLSVSYVTPIVSVFELYSLSQHNLGRWQLDVMHMFSEGCGLLSVWRDQTGLYWIITVSWKQEVVTQKNHVLSQATCVQKHKKDMNHIPSCVVNNLNVCPKETLVTHIDGTVLHKYICLMDWLIMTPSPQTPITCEAYTQADFVESTQTHLRCHQNIKCPQQRFS